MVFGILLARLLTPDDFGLLAMVAIFAGFTALLADVGLGSALVQKRDATDLHFNSVFWTNMALGGALTLALFSASGGIAAFFQRQELVAIVQILSLQFILGGLSMVQRQRLSRALRFKMLSLADLAGLLVAGLLAITLAWQGFGYCALVAQSLTQRLGSTAIIWAGSGWSPRLHFSIEALQELFGFSLYVFATRTLQYFTTNVDKLITGRMRGGGSGRSAEQGSIHHANSLAEHFAGYRQRQVSCAERDPGRPTPGTQHLPASHPLHCPADLPDDDGHLRRGRSPGPGPARGALAGAGAHPPYSLLRRHCHVHRDHYRLELSLPGDIGRAPCRGRARL